MHIGFAWELGGRGGHRARWRVVRDALRARGCRVTSILREGVGDEALPAPIERDPMWAGRRVRSCADVLAKTVWRPGLAQRVDAWRALLDRLGVDVLVADYAPTALLAGRIMGLPTVTLGTGFSRCPSAGWTADLPRLAGLKLAPDPHLAQRAEAVCDRIAALPGMPDVGQLDDVFVGVPDLRCGFEALDPYTSLWAPGAARWLGTLPTPTHPAPRWPAGDGARVLVYAGQSAATVTAVTRLRALGHRVLDLAVQGPVDLPRAVAEAEAVVCQGNYGVVAEALRGGRPMALLPVDVEKGLIARRVLALGAGRLLNAADPAAIVAGTLEVLGDVSMRAMAARYAAEHVQHRPARTLGWICDVIMGLPDSPA